jgi:hypothetical protein
LGPAGKLGVGELVGGRVVDEVVVADVDICSTEDEDDEVVVTP